MSTSVGLLAAVTLIVRLLVVLLTYGDCATNRKDVLANIASGVIFVSSLGLIRAGHSFNTVELVRDLLVACGLVGIGTTLGLPENT